MLLRNHLPGASSVRHRGRQPYGSCPQLHWSPGHRTAALWFLSPTALESWTQDSSPLVPVPNCTGVLDTGQQPSGSCPQLHWSPGHRTAALWFLSPTALESWTQDSSPLVPVPNCTGVLDTEDGSPTVPVPNCIGVLDTGQQPSGSCPQLHWSSGHRGQQPSGSCPQLHWSSGHRGQQPSGSCPQLHWSPGHRGQQPSGSCPQLHWSPGHRGQQPSGSCPQLQ